MKYTVITFGCRVNQADSLGFEEQLLAAECIQGKRIRLIGVGGTNLVRPEIQGDLFDRKDEMRARVSKAVDGLRAKLGPGAVKRGSSIS